MLLVGGAGLAAVPADSLAQHAMPMGGMTMPDAQPKQSPAGTAKPHAMPDRSATRPAESGETVDHATIDHRAMGHAAQASAATPDPMAGMAHSQMDHGAMPGMAAEHASMAHAAMGHAMIADPAYRAASDAASAKMPAGSAMAGMAMGTSAGFYGQGSGTSRLPTAEGPMRGYMTQAGEWMLMAHGYAWGVATDQGGPRGRREAFVQSMAMVMADRDLGERFHIQLRAMNSLEPLMGARGYTNLFATANSRTDARWSIASIRTTCSWSWPQSSITGWATARPSSSMAGRWASLRWGRARSCTADRRAISRCRRSRTTGSIRRTSPMAW